MNWEAFHHRGDVLHTVIAEVDVRRDGTLPMDLPGVSETFRDELDLLSTLSLKWTTRLQGQIERELAEQPLNLEAAVIAAWRSAASELPGVRLVLDHYQAAPVNDEMAEALKKAELKQHQMFALMSGLVSTVEQDDDGARIGKAIEQKARSNFEIPNQRTAAEDVPFLVRLRAALAA